MKKTSMTICFVVLLLLVHITQAEERLAAAISSVVFLRSDGKAAEFKYGSGVFVATEKNPYLVTAGHVAKALTLQATATVRSESDKPLTILIADLNPKELAFN
jgi:hypothetical protein